MMVQGAQPHSPPQPFPMCRPTPGLAAAPPTNAHMHLNPPPANTGAAIHQSLPQGLPQGLPQPEGHSASTTSDSIMQPPPALGKRKAETQDNERLSKRLSLLNLERNGPKLYVPVETPTAAPTQPSSRIQTATPVQGSMQLDDSKHKVYIYNLDDELSSDSEDEEGKLVFLPDIEKHLRDNRIPKQVLANSDGELAGMQLVLYRDPKSLIVPEGKDGAREAITEARQRARGKQSLEVDGGRAVESSAASTGADDDEMELD